MADQIAITTFNTPVSNTVLNITHSDITDTFKAAIFIVSANDSDDSNDDHGILGMGFLGVDGSQATTTLQCAVCCQIEKGEDVGQECNTDRSIQDCVYISDGALAGTPQVLGQYSASIAGGVAINFSTVAATSYKCTAILFAGLDKAAAGACTFNELADGDEDVGVSPFWEPDLVIFRASDNTVGNGDNPNATIALGFAINRDTISQVSAYVNADDATDPTDADGFISSSNCSTAFEGAIRTFADRFHVVGFDSTGFSGRAVNSGAGTQSPQANYLALKFTDTTLPIACDNVPVSTDASQSFSVGIQPRFVLGMSTLMTSEDTLTDGATATSAGLFAFTATDEQAHSAHNQEALNLNPATSIADCRRGEHAVLTLASGGAVAQQASFSAFTATGFNLSFSTATAGFLTVLAIGTGAQTIVQSDTETISDDVLAMLFRSLVDSDTVTITETALLGTNDVTVTDGPEGYTFNARAERGTAYNAGAEAGTSF